MRALALLLVLVLPVAAAGTPEAPEVTDPAGDCAFATGNQYADIVAAWITDETADAFWVGIQLAAMTDLHLATFTGYTIQFTHQGVQWGVAAFYDPTGGGWEFTTAQIDVENAELGGFEDTEGSYDAATLTLKILFPKSLFPHDGNDNALTNFVGGSADLKKDVPILMAQSFGAPIPPAGPLMVCDTVQSSAVYTFTVGAHSQHGAATDDATNTTATPEPEVVEAAQTSPTPPSPAESADTPGLPLALVLVAVALVALRSRRA